MGETANTRPINMVLLDALARRPHPHLHIPADTLPNAVTTALEQTRTALHLLDLIAVPAGTDGTGRDTGRNACIDARTYLAMRLIQEQGERLARIADWHSRESGPCGTFDDRCTECGQSWPCDTRRLAQGSTPSTHTL